MREAGILLNVFGVLFTWWAIMVEHRGRALPSLAPRLTVRASRSWHWLLRVVGGSKSVNIHAPAGSAHGHFSWQGTVSGWAPIAPSDDIAVRVDKLDRNLTSLREQMSQSTSRHAEALSSIDARLTQRVEGVEQGIAEREQRDTRATTRAMFWEVVGLGIVLLGTLLTVLG